MMQDRKVCGTAMLGLALALTQAINAGGPIVPGVQSCTVTAGDGTVYDFSYLCPPEDICCIAPVWGACPPGQTGPCLIDFRIACCDPNEDCWYQVRQGKLYVWCGEPFPP